MFITLSPASPDPLYKQITDQIRDAITLGEIAANEPLPSIRELSEALKTSAITVKRAYFDLEKEGCIITRAGLGSYVADIDPRQLRERKLQELRMEIARIVKSGAKFNIGRDDLLQPIGSLEEK